MGIERTTVPPGQVPGAPAPSQDVIEQARKTISDKDWQDRFRGCHNLRMAYRRAG
jgi:hypothetical protein